MLLRLWLVRFFFFFYMVDLIPFLLLWQFFPITFISYIPVLNLASFHLGEFGSCRTSWRTDNQLLVEIQSINRLLRCHLAFDSSAFSLKKSKINNWKIPKSPIFNCYGWKAIGKKQTKTLTLKTMNKMKSTQNYTNNSLKEKRTKIWATLFFFVWSVILVAEQLLKYLKWSSLIHNSLCQEWGEKWRGCNSMVTRTSEQFTSSGILFSKFTDLVLRVKFGRKSSLPSPHSSFPTD